MTSLAAASKVSYSTIYRHCRKLDELRPATARKLEIWSKGRISAAKIMGIKL